MVVNELVEYENVQSAAWQLGGSGRGSAAFALAFCVLLLQKKKEDSRISGWGSLFVRHLSISNCHIDGWSIANVGFNLILVTVEELLQYDSH